MVGIGRPSRPGGTACQDRIDKGYPPNAECLNQDIFDANQVCSGGGQIPLPTSCSNDVYSCVNSPNAVFDNEPGRIR
jgi:hypothetical protein